MFSKTLLLSLALAAQSALAAPLQSRSVISHDAVVGFPETVPATTVGSLMLKYKPLLKVFTGCVPFPAVDSAGNTGYVFFLVLNSLPQTHALTFLPLLNSGGLSPSGSPSGDCDSSTGQIYARAVAYEEYFAIMYSWYMPKDEPSDGLGHRHDWEEAIVWLSSDAADATLEAFSVSAHGGLSTTSSPSMSGNSPLAGYISYWPLDHQLIQTTTVGGSQPLIAWDSLTSAAQTALATTDFGSAIVPFKDDTFTANLAKGYATL